jgi:hypothetical protein
MAGREVVTVEIEQPLCGTAPSETIGEAMDQAVVEGEHERRVECAASIAAASGVLTFPARSSVMAGRYDIGLARKKGAASGALEMTLLRGRYIGQFAKRNPEKYSRRRIV